MRVRNVEVEFCYSINIWSVHTACSYHHAWHLVPCFIGLNASSLLPLSYFLLLWPSSSWIYSHLTYLVCFRLTIHFPHWSGPLMQVWVQSCGFEVVLVHFQTISGPVHFWGEFRLPSNWTNYKNLAPFWTSWATISPLVLLMLSMGYKKWAVVGQRMHLFSFRLWQTFDNAVPKW